MRICWTAIDHPRVRERVDQIGIVTDLVAHRFETQPAAFDPLDFDHNRLACSVSGYRGATPDEVSAC